MTPNLTEVEELINAISPLDPKERFEELYRLLKEAEGEKIRMRLAGGLEVKVHYARVLRDTCYWLALTHVKEGDVEKALGYLSEAKDLAERLESLGKLSWLELRWLRAGALRWLSFTSMTAEDMERNIELLIRQRL